jgi:hypothetical protein
MLKHSLVLLTMVFLAQWVRADDDDSPDYSMTDSSISISNGEVSGHIAGCLMVRKRGHVAFFGLDKQPKRDTAYTFFAVVLVRDQDRTAGTGSSSEVSSDGNQTQWKSTFNVGDREFTFSRRQQIEGDNVVKESVQLGDQTLGEGGVRVVLIDLRGEKPRYTPLKADLPPTAPELADQEYKTWPDAIGRTMAALKEKSPELRKLLEEK